MEQIRCHKSDPFGTVRIQHHSRAAAQPGPAGGGGYKGGRNTNPIIPLFTIYDILTSTCERCGLILFLRATAHISKDKTNIGTAHKDWSFFNPHAPFIIVCHSGKRSLPHQIFTS